MLTVRSGPSEETPTCTETSQPLDWKHVQARLLEIQSTVREASCSRASLCLGSRAPAATSPVPRKGHLDLEFVRKVATEECSRLVSEAHESFADISAELLDIAISELTASAQAIVTAVREEFWADLEKVHSVLIEAKDNAKLAVKGMDVALRQEFSAEVEHSIRALREHMEGLPLLGPSEPCPEQGCATPPSKYTGSALGLPHELGEMQKLVLSADEAWRAHESRLKNLESQLEEQRESEKRAVLDEISSLRSRVLEVSEAVVDATRMVDKQSARLAEVEAQLAQPEPESDPITCSAQAAFAGDHKQSPAVTGAEPTRPEAPGGCRVRRHSRVRSFFCLRPVQAVAD